MKKARCGPRLISLPVSSPAPSVASSFSLNPHIQQKDLSLVDSILQMPLNPCTSIHAAPSPCGFLQRLPNPASMMHPYMQTDHSTPSTLKSLPSMFTTASSSAGPGNSFLTPASFSSPICCNFQFFHHKFLSFKMHHIFPLTSLSDARFLPAPLHTLLT